MKRASHFKISTMHVHRLNYSNLAVLHAGGTIKVEGVSPSVPGSYISAESAGQAQYGSPSMDSHGFPAKVSKDRSSMETLSSIPLGDHSAGKALNQGGSSTGAITNKVILNNTVTERLNS